MWVRRPLNILLSKAISNHEGLEPKVTGGDNNRIFGDTSIGR